MHDFVRVIFLLLLRVCKAIQQVCQVCFAHQQTLQFLIHSLQRFPRLHFQDFFLLFFRQVFNTYVCKRPMRYSVFIPLLCGRAAGRVLIARLPALLFRLLLQGIFPLVQGFPFPYAAIVHAHSRRQFFCADFPAAFQVHFFSFVPFRLSWPCHPVFPPVRSFSAFRRSRSCRNW